MELILWRHAEAEDAGPGGDLARALTKKGRKQAQRMAEWLAPRLTEDWRVRSSPARRALETASALDREVEERAGLAPGADAASILREAGWPAGPHPVVVVGHEPTLGEAAARLLGSRADLPIRKGAIWWFAEKRGSVVLLAVLDPDHL